MIVVVCVSINEIVEKERDFSWPRPDRCPQCGGPRLWFHGFVSAFFDGFTVAVWLRRVRCPDCRAVHRMRPAGYFKRFQASVVVIRACIVRRLTTGRWLSGLSRQRQGHWLRSLQKKALAFLGLTGLLYRLEEAFDRLICKGEIPVSRSFKAKLPAGETYPTQECRCDDCTAEIGGPPSYKQEGPPWTKTTDNGLRSSDSRSLATWWEMRSFRRESKSDSSGKNATANGTSRSPPRRRLTRSTILRWVKLYKESGGQLDALVNQLRSDRGRSRAIDRETGLALIRIRQEFPKATVARLIETMESRKLVSPGSSLAPATAWRFLKQHGMLKPDAPVPEDRRKFEAELPNDLWQSDCMHGPAVELRRQTSQDLPPCLHRRSLKAYSLCRILLVRIAGLLSEGS